MISHQMIKSKKIEIILNKPHKNSGVKNTITEMECLLMGLSSISDQEEKKNQQT